MTLILGASTSPDRYAYKAARMLTSHGHEIVPVGIHEGEVFGKKILNNKEVQPGVDTVTLYVSPRNQKEWYDYIVKTKPKRVIFNPGTENEELRDLAEKNGIQTEEACTLVLLTLGQY